MEIRREISVAKQLKFRVADNKVYSFEQISSFNCLGVIITGKSEKEEEIRNRLLKRSKSAGAMSKLLKTKYLTKKGIIRLHEGVMRPAVLYGCETWMRTKRT